MFKRLEIGRVYSELPAATLNEMMAAIEKLLRDGAPPAQMPSIPFRDPGIIRVKNTVGAANSVLPVFSVLGVGNLLSTPTSAPSEGSSEPQDNGAQFQSPIIEGVTPTTADHSSKFVITQHSCYKDGGVDGRSLGFTFVKVSVTDTSHDFAAVKDSDTTQLKSATTGPCEIWWLEDEHEDEDPIDSDHPQTLWALVKMGGGGGGTGEINAKFGRAAGIISKATGWALDDAGTGDWQELDDDGDPVGDPIQVKNRYFDDIPEDTPVYVISGLAFVLNAGCTAGPA